MFQIRLLFRNSSFELVLAVSVSDFFCPNAGGIETHIYFLAQCLLKVSIFSNLWNNFFSLNILFNTWKYNMKLHAGCTDSHSCHPNKHAFLSCSKCLSRNFWIPGRPQGSRSHASLLWRTAAGMIPLEWSQGQSANNLEIRFSSMPRSYSQWEGISFLQADWVVYHSPVHGDVQTN